MFWSLFVLLGQPAPPAQPPDEVTLGVVGTGDMDGLVFNHAICVSRVCRRMPPQAAFKRLRQSANSGADWRKASTSPRRAGLGVSIHKWPRLMSGPPLVSMPKKRVEMSSKPACFRPTPSSAMRGGRSSKAARLVQSNVTQSTEMRSAAKEPELSGVSSAMKWLSPLEGVGIVFVRHNHLHKEG